VEINEYLVVMLLVIISISIIGFVVGFYYFSIRARAQVEKANKESFKIQSDKLAIEKRKEEKNLAVELKEENKRLALDVKDSMLNHVGTLISTMKSDLELHKTILLSELSMLRSKQDQLQGHLTLQKENQVDVNRNMQRQLDMINQFTWGVDAKSIPPYVTGDVESQEHKDKPAEGMFSSPDSTKTETQKHTDKKDKI
jgi:hypothetical protein